MKKKVKNSNLNMKTLLQLQRLSLKSRRKLCNHRWHHWEFTGQIPIQKNYGDKSDFKQERFSIVLKGIAKDGQFTLLIFLSTDEVKNGKLDEKFLYKSEFKLACIISEEEYYETFSSLIPHIYRN